MTFNVNTRHITALALVALMVMSVFAAGIGAAASTTADSDLDDSETDDVTDNVVADFNASDDETTTVEVETEQEFDADDLDDADVTIDDWETFELEIEYENVTHADTVVVDDADDAISLAEDEGDSPAEATFEIDHDELERLPGSSDEGTVTDVTITEAFEDADHEDADEDDMVEVETEFLTEFEFASDHAVMFITETDDVEDEERFLRSDIFTAEASDDVTIGDDDTTVDVYTDDDDLADGVDLATEATDDGDRVGAMMASTLDGSLTYVYDGSPGETITGDDVEDEGNAHIVVHDDDHYEIVPGDDFDADDEIDADLVANDRPDMGDLRDDLDYGVLAALAGAWGLSIPFIGGVLAGAFVVHRRRQPVGA